MYSRKPRQRRYISRPLAVRRGIRRAVSARVTPVSKTGRPMIAAPASSPSAKPAPTPSAAIEAREEVQRPPLLRVRGKEAVGADALHVERLLYLGQVKVKEALYVQVVSTDRFFP